MPPQEPDTRQHRIPATLVLLAAMDEAQVGTIRWTKTARRAPRAATRWMTISSKSSIWSKSDTVDAVWIAGAAGATRWSQCPSANHHSHPTPMLTTGQTHEKPHPAESRRGGGDHTQLIQGIVSSHEQSPKSSGLTAVLKIFPENSGPPPKTPIQIKRCPKNKRESEQNHRQSQHQSKPKRRR